MSSDEYSEYSEHSESDGSFTSKPGGYGGRDKRSYVALPPSDSSSHKESFLKKHRWTLLLLFLLALTAAVALPLLLPIMWVTMGAAWVVVCFTVAAAALDVPSFRHMYALRNSRGKHLWADVITTLLAIGISLAVFFIPAIVPAILGALGLAAGGAIATTAVPILLVAITFGLSYTLFTLIKIKAFRIYYSRYEVSFAGDSESGSTSDVQESSTVKTHHQFDLAQAQPDSRDLSKKTSIDSGENSPLWVTFSDAQSDNGATGESRLSGSLGSISVFSRSTSQASSRNNSANDETETASVTNSCCLSLKLFKSI